MASKTKLRTSLDTIRSRVFQLFLLAVLASAVESIAFTEVSIRVLKMGAGKRLCSLLASLLPWPSV
jgi:hypothetical protein